MKIRAIGSSTLLGASSGPGIAVTVALGLFVLALLALFATPVVRFLRGTWNP